MYCNTNKMLQLREYSTFHIPEISKKLHYTKPSNHAPNTETKTPFNITLLRWLQPSWETEQPMGNYLWYCHD